jgi:parallel beta-helix repeat protein
MKKLIFLLAILLGIGISLSGIDNSTEDNVTIQIMLKPYYFINETFNFTIQPVFDAIEFNILNNSSEYVARNITNNFTLDLPAGIYYLETKILDKNYTNITSFEIIEPEIDVYPRVIFVNESFFVFIRDYSPKFFEIKIYPEVFYNFTSFNETTILEFSLNESGNYTVFVNEMQFNIQVLPYLGEYSEKKYLNMSLSSNKVLPGENITIAINGSSNTSFNLELFYNGTNIMQIIDKTNEEGFYSTNISLEQTGIYELLLEYDESRINETITVYPANFTVDGLKEIYESSNVSFIIHGPPLKDFSLYFATLNLSKVYSMRTDAKGEAEFSDFFDEGEYNLTIVYEGNTMFETNFSVKIFSNESYEAVASNGLGDDSYLELDEDVLGDNSAILIRGRNITLDCKGHRIVSNNTGIVIENSNMVRLTNCLLESNKIGVLIKDSSDIRITNFSTFSNTNGIIAKNSSDVIVYDSDLTGVEFYGFLLFSSTGDAMSSKIKTSTNIDILYALKS